MNDVEWKWAFVRIRMTFNMNMLKNASVLGRMYVLEPVSGLLPLRDVANRSILFCRTGPARTGGFSAMMSLV